MNWLLAALAAGTLQAEPPPALINPGFGSGLEGWTVTAAPGFAVLERTRRDAHWVSIGWDDASPAPPGVEARLSTIIDARPYRARRLRLTTLTRAPEPADRVSRLYVRISGPSGDMTHALPIMSSDGWRRHSLQFVVPFEARTIEIGFIVPGRFGQLEADGIGLDVAG